MLVCGTVIVVGMKHPFRIVRKKHTVNKFCGCYQEERQSRTGRKTGTRGARASFPVFIVQIQALFTSCGIIHFHLNTEISYNKGKQVKMLAREFAFVMCAREQVDKHEGDSRQIGGILLGCQKGG